MNTRYVSIFSRAQCGTSTVLWIFNHAFEVQYCVKKRSEMKQVSLLQLCRRYIIQPCSGPTRSVHLPS
jgi:hypothetical protein